MYMYILYKILCRTWVISMALITFTLNWSMSCCLLKLPICSFLYKRPALFISILRPISPRFSSTTCPIFSISASLQTSENRNNDSYQSKIEKVPRGIRGEKSRKDMASSRNLVSTIMTMHMINIV